MRNYCQLAFSGVLEHDVATMRVEMDPTPNTDLLAQ
jgi:hypothetical protein